MTDIFIGDLNVDAEGPLFTNRVPLTAAVDVFELSDVSFDVTDMASGVVLASLDVEINGIPAIANGVNQIGYAVVITPITGGYHIVINPTSSFTSYQLITVHAYARDAAPLFNETDTSWSFTTGDSFNPLISNISPDNNAVNMLSDADVSFYITDEGGSGVAYGTINVTLNGVQGLVNGVLQPGFFFSSTAITGGFSFTVRPFSGFLFFTVYTVNVTAEDIAGNRASATWSFTTESGVVESPVLSAEPVDAGIHLPWTVNPLMTVALYQLRKSLITHPLTPLQGELIYEGTSTSFLDVNTIVDVKHYYTIFVIRRYSLAIPVYVPYEPLASDNAITRILSVGDIKVVEYVPQRGEFGPKVYRPIGTAFTVGVWGDLVPRGRPLTYDVVTSRIGDIVTAPVSGVISALVQTVGANLWSASIDGTYGGFRFHLRGISPASGLAVGATLVAGDIVGQAACPDVEFEIVKLPAGRYGDRSVRPAYFYVAVEERA